jgi:hypothetical protein
MKEAGAIFPPEIIALFENVEDEQNSDEEETESVEEVDD